MAETSSEQTTDCLNQGFDTRSSRTEFNDEGTSCDSSEQTDCQSENIPAQYEFQFNGKINNSDTTESPNVKQKHETVPYNKINVTIDQDENLESNQFSSLNALGKHVSSVEDTFWGKTAQIYQESESLTPSSFYVANLENQDLKTLTEDQESTDSAESETDKQSIHSVNTQDDVTLCKADQKDQLLGNCTDLSVNLVPVNNSYVHNDSKNYTSTSSRSNIGLSNLQDNDSNLPHSTHIDDITCRRRSKRKSTETRICPVCGKVIKIDDLENHWFQEYSRISHSGKKRVKHDKEHNDEQNDRKVFAWSLMQNLLQVRKNRKTRNSKRNADLSTQQPDQNVPSCPVCNTKLQGSSQEMNQHVELCLANQGDEDSVIDIEGEADEYEEYTWAGQTRIRATTLIQGGLAGSGFQTGRKGDEEDMDLNVDDDDAETYGPPQYTDADLIPCNEEMSEEAEENRELREAYLRSQNVDMQDIPSHRTRWDSVSPDEDLHSSSTTGGAYHCREAKSNEVISSLKCKIKDQELQLAKEKVPKCLICMEPYQNPCVSVQCWHVHCEECWLRTLGVKKLCPQCNMIISAADLRRIYL